MGWKKIIAPSLVDDTKRTSSSSLNNPISETPMTPGGIDLNLDSIDEHLTIEQLQRLPEYPTRIEPFLPQLGDLKRFMGYSFTIDNVERTTVKEFLAAG